MIKLIASDLDGTLLNHKTKEMDPEIIPIILKLKEKGIRFVAASGRPYENQRELFAPIKDEISYICENGACGFHAGKAFAKEYLDRELALRIIREIEAFPDGRFSANCDGMTYIKNDGSEHMRNTLKYMQGHARAIDNPEDIDPPFFKICMFHKDALQEGQTHFKELFKKECETELKIVPADTEFLDFIPKSANKGITLKKLIDKLGIKPEECMAFGDQYNDVEMLQLVGTSYTMRTAAPGMNYYSTYVTDSVKEVLIDMI